MSQLTDGKTVTRQAVSKHLCILEDAGLVHSTRAGREHLFELDMRPFKDVKDYRGFVSYQLVFALCCSGLLCLRREHSLDT